MALQRSASAQWQGDGLTGQGQLTTQSGVFQSQPYSFNTRFKSEDGKAGTNPEELIAAAHAGCYAMALSFMLAGAGYPAERLDVSARVEMDKIDGHFAIVGIALTLQARVPGLADAEVLAFAEKAKAGCPVSQALKAVPIRLEAQVVAA
jgi:osmotically inducible protein OsmC